MARSTDKARKTATTTARIDVYEEVTNQIVELLEAGTRPWSPRWASGAASLPLRPIGRAHVCTPVTNAPLVCPLLLAKKKTQYKVTPLDHQFDLIPYSHIEQS